MVLCLYEKYLLNDKNLKLIKFDTYNILYHNHLIKELYHEMELYLYIP